MDKKTTDILYRYRYALLFLLCAASTLFSFIGTDRLRYGAVIFCGVMAAMAVMFFRRGGLNGLLRRGGRALLRAFAFKLLDARPQSGHRFVVAGRPGRLSGGPLFDRCLRRPFGRGGPDQIAEQRAADERRPGDQDSCTCLHGWKYSIHDRQSLGVLAFPAGVMALTERIERRRLFPSRYSHPETSSVPG